MKSRWKTYTGLAFKDGLTYNYLECIFIEEKRRGEKNVINKRNDGESSITCIDIFCG